MYAIVSASEIRPVSGSFLLRDTRFGERWLFDVSDATKKTYGIYPIVVLNAFPDTRYYTSISETYQYNSANETVEKTYSAVTRSLAECKLAKLLELREERRLREQAGVVYTSVTIDSSPAGTARLTSVYDHVQRRPARNINWDLGNNNFIILNKQQFETMTDLVTEHVQACFEAQKSHSEAINALTTVTNVINYDVKSGFWP